MQDGEVNMVIHHQVRRIEAAKEGTHANDTNT
jgi:hypothetical protein